MSTSIDMFIDRKVVVLHKNDSALQAAHAMCRGQVGCVLIVDQNSHFCGMVTDRDLVCNLISEELNSETKLKNIMQTNIVHLNEDSSIEQAIEIMKENGIRRLPIIEDIQRNKQRCVGMLTLDDLIAGEFVQSKDLSDIVKAQIFRKKKILKRHPGADSRAEQTYNRFIKQISDNIKLDKNKTESVVRFILGSLIRRLHYTGGAHFISQLPKHLQEELFELPAGPDRTVTDSVILEGLSVLTGKSTKESREFMRHFWKTLCEIIGPGETDHVINQLPDSLKRLLIEEEYVTSPKFYKHKQASGGESWDEFG